MTPKIGEIRKGIEIGRTKQAKYRTYIWQACKECGAERWVEFKCGKPDTEKCRRCAAIQNLKYIKPPKGKEHYRWAGGKKKEHGYILVRLSPDDPFYPMARSDGRVREHRLIIAKELGRCLLKSEYVHHIDGVRDNNKRENLLLVSQSSHKLYNMMCANCALRKEIRLLRWQVMELSKQLQGKLTLT